MYQQTLTDKLVYDRMIGDSWKDDGFIVTDPPTAAPTGWKGDEWKDDGFERKLSSIYFSWHSSWLLVFLILRSLWSLHESYR